MSELIQIFHPNHSINWTLKEYPENSSPAVKVIACVVYPTIILLSALGNSFVILTVARSAAMRNITNLFIANLAVSDLLMSFVSAPFTPLAFYMNSWKFPNLLCNLLPMTMGISLYVSTLTSTAIASDRYLLIVRPLVTRMSHSICGIIIASIWLFSFIVTLPIGIYQEVKLDPLTKVENCVQAWPKKSSQSAYTIVTFILQFVVPCFIISICYYRVSRVLRARCDLRIGSGQRNREKEETDIRRKRRTNNMLIAMVIIFVICWIPLHALWIVVDALGNEFEESPHFNNLFLLCHMVAMSSAVYNPFFYAWLNNNFRQEFLSILKCSRNSESPNVQTRSEFPRDMEITFLSNRGKKRKSSARKSLPAAIPKRTHMSMADGDGGIWYGPQSTSCVEDTIRVVEIA